MKHELRALREQLKEDFQSTRLAMATQRDAVDEALRTTRNALKAQEDALQGLLGRTEKGLGKVINLVNELDSRVEDHELRLRKLEEEAA